MITQCLMQDFRTEMPRNEDGPIKCSECGRTVLRGNWYSKTCGTPECKRARKTRLQKERRGT